MLDPNDWWVIAGRALGYPDCCIEAFVLMEHVGGPKRKLHGTGYVPCAECNEEFTEEQLIANITASRDPTFKPFPHQHRVERDVIPRTPATQRERPRLRRGGHPRRS